MVYIDIYRYTYICTYTYIHTYIYMALKSDCPSWPKVRE